MFRVERGGHEKAVTRMRPDVVVVATPRFDADLDGGTSRRRIRLRVSTSITRADRIPPPTSIARHSRVNSSMIVGLRGGAASAASLRRHPRAEAGVPGRIRSDIAHQTGARFSGEFDVNRAA